MSQEAVGGPPPGWVPHPIDPRSLPPHLRPSIPVEERDYYAFWRAPRYRWWKGLLAALLAGFGFFVVSVVAAFAGWAIDGVDLSVLLEGRIPPVGPGFFTANNVGLALCIPIAMLASWLCVQQRPRWLSSVGGGLRWGWLLELVGVLAPLWLVVVGVQTLLGPLDDVRVRDHTGVMVLAILLTTPLQSAGEEYLVRGLLGRVVGSWFGHPVVGVVAATVVTAGVFMVLHGAGDPWLNAYYVFFAVAGTWLTWRTGGLEAAIAMHVVNNVVSMITLPFVDFSDLFNREAGVADATILIQVAVVLGGVALVEWRARKRSLTVRSAPGRPALDALTAPHPFAGGTPGGGAGLVG